MLRRAYTVVRSASAAHPIVIARKTPKVHPNRSKRISTALKPSWQRFEPSNDGDEPDSRQRLHGCLTGPMRGRQVACPLPFVVSDPPHSGMMMTSGVPDGFTSKSAGQPLLNARNPRGLA